jgi:hypothetical protein
VERLTPGGWNPDAVREVATIDHEGDLTVLLGLPSTEPIDELETTLPGIEIGREVRPLVTASGAKYDEVVAVDFSVTGESVVRGHTLVMHDSYGWALTPMLAPYLETAAFIAENDPGVGHLQDDLEAAELIIFEIVQRSLHETILDRDLAADFVAAYATDLEVLEDGVRNTGERLELAAGDEDVYVVVEIPPGNEGAEVAYGDVTAVLTPDSPRAAYRVGEGGTMFFAGVVEYRIVSLS